MLKYFIQLAANEGEGTMLGVCASLHECVLS